MLARIVLSIVRGLSGACKFKGPGGQTMARNVIEDAAFCRSVLADHSAYLNGLTKQADAAIGYNDLAEAMYWTDELPEDAPREVWKCHFILMSLRGFVIFQSSNLAIDALFEEFRRVASGWAFLSSERFSPSLQQTYLRLYDQAGERMDAAFEQFERRKRRQEQAREAEKGEE